MSRRKRIAALEALRQPDYEPLPDMQPWIDAAMATCDAHESGRPYSHWSNPLRPPVEPWEGQDAFMQQHLEMAKRVQGTPEWADEQAERERRQARIMVLIGRDDRRRAERAERKRLAAV